MENLINKIIDNYQIVEIIGRGGMGVVFKAVDTNLDKVMAIKMIDPLLARDESFVRRFKTEARALAKVENQHIVTVHALRDTPAGLFMVMEYVESKSLSTLLKENGPFKINETLEITEQVLDALGHAHNSGVLHRDIKPGNILLMQDGRVKITDFGLAKVIQKKGGDSTLTQSVAGTLYYMSPEQIKGLKNVDKRSDIYSLGITVYEMITGRIPFDKTDSDFTIQKMIVDGEIPSPSKFNNVIPRKLINIISRAIHKDPEKRYQTAEEMLEDIRAFHQEYTERKNYAKATHQISPGKIRYTSIGAAVLVICAAVYYFIFNPGTTGIRLLNISTVPAGADVLINNNNVGKSPLVHYRIETAGEYKVNISSKGYLPLDTLLSIQDSVNTFGFNLTALSVVRFGINTVPSGADIYIDNKIIGTSPVNDYSYPQGISRFKIEKQGYTVIDTTISIDNKFSGIHNFSLTEAAAITGAKLVVRSDPSGAQVIINGRTAGRTPLSTDKIKEGDNLIEISKPGYKKYSERIKADINSSLLVNGKLEAIITGFEILIRPFGTLYIDGKLKISDSNSLFKTEIAGGTHKLKIVHPALGEYERDLNITEEKIYRINVDLTRILKLTIASNPVNCEIIINGKSTGKFTPAQLRLIPGNYKIQLVKNGYTSSEEILYSVSKAIYEEQADREDRKLFELKKNH